LVSRLAFLAWLPLHRARGNGLSTRSCERRALVRLISGYLRHVAFLKDEIILVVLQLLF
jgi:hypothetical protein